MLVVIGIIGVLAGVGINLFKKQGESAKDRVTETNLQSIFKSVQTNIALGSETVDSDLDETLKIKGKLSTDCWNVGSIQGSGSVTSGTIGAEATAWCVGFVTTACNKTTTGSLTEADVKGLRTGCIDYQGTITLESTTNEDGLCNTSGICS